MASAAYDTWLAERRAERKAKFETYSDGLGRPTKEGQQAVCRAVGLLKEFLSTDHLDNTGAACRFDLRGHDCCYVCGFAEEVLRTLAGYDDE